MTTLTLIGKPDCHLCDVARDIVELVVADYPDDAVDVQEHSILDDPALYALWWEKIPVVLIDGDFHAHWRVSADRLSRGARGGVELTDRAAVDRRVLGRRRTERSALGERATGPGGWVRGRGR